MHRDIPIIICTAYGDFRSDFGTWSSDAYLTKSSDLQEWKTRYTSYWARCALVKIPAGGGGDAYARGREPRRRRCQPKPQRGKPSRNQRFGHQQPTANAHVGLAQGFLNLHAMPGATRAEEHMKKIEAIIKPFKLDEVKNALRRSVSRGSR